MWEEFSSNETLFDLWELRYAIILAYNFPLHFYTVLQSGKPVAFLPLWYNTEEELYEFVGGFYPEENYFFCHNKDLIPKVLEIIPKPAQLLGISTKRMPKDFDKSPFSLSATQIKRACQRFKETGEKEVRILCKQDSREDRPDIFVKNNLFLLPVKNGYYSIIKGDGYIDIPEVKKEVIGEFSKNNSLLPFKVIPCGHRSNA